MCPMPSWPEPLEPKANRAEDILLLFTGFFEPIWESLAVSLELGLSLLLLDGYSRKHSFKP